jgi:hypothetical protein
LIDLLFGRNLHFIAKVTCPVAAGLNRWVLDGTVLHEASSHTSAA